MVTGQQRLKETLLKNLTNTIKYGPDWDFGDSYSAWWIFLLLSEWIGEKIIPVDLRKPIYHEAFYFWNWAWIGSHFIGISTVFISEIYLGHHLYGVKQ